MSGVPAAGRRRRNIGENGVMTPNSAAIIRDARRRARSDASLLVALVAFVLAPMPGLLLGGSGAPSAVLHTLLGAALIFAVPPFLIGGGFGTLVHLGLTARERMAAIEAGSKVLISPPSLIGTSLLAAAVFGSIGFTIAAALSQAA